MNIFGIYDKYHNSVKLLQNYVQNYDYAVMASIKKPAKQRKQSLLRELLKKIVRSIFHLKETTHITILMRDPL